MEQRSRLTDALPLPGGSGGGIPLLARWFAIGPAPIAGGQTDISSCRVEASGRASVIAVNPANPDEVWLGTARGGIWRSTNGGQSWTPLTDGEISFAIGAMALEGCDAGGCATVYAGTGENRMRRDTYYGAGLLIGEAGPTPGEFTWTLHGEELFEFASLIDVVLDPTTSGGTKRIYVALSSGVTASASESTVTAPEPPLGYGIYLSEDRGASWQKLAVPGTDGARPTDLEMDPQDPNVLHAGFLARGIFKGIRDPASGAISWCSINPGLPAACPSAAGLPDPALDIFDFVEISVHRPSLLSDAVLYAIFGDCPSPILTKCGSAIYQSVDGGVTWSLKVQNSPLHYSRYTHVIAIHPTDPSTIYFGGILLWKSETSGQTFTEIGTCTLHPDHQDLVFPDPTNPLRMYDASDGGFAFSEDGGETWTSGNGGLQITGFQSMTASPLTDRVIGGSQDNGTNMWMGTSIWDHRDDGDSASTIIDLGSALVMYDIETHPKPRRSLNGGACCWWSQIYTGIDINEDSAFYPPMVQDPTVSPGVPDPSIYPSYHKLYLGTKRLYRSSLPPGENTSTWRAGDSWEVVSCPLGGEEVLFEDIRVTNVITAIAVAPSDPDRIYVGYYDGQVFVTDQACVDADCKSPACWRPGSGLPSTVVTRIAVHPTERDVAYLTLSGFALDGCAHVYMTVDGGENWIPASGPDPCDPEDLTSLPDIPANTIHLVSAHPESLFLGTDIGVFVSADGGGHWQPFQGQGIRRLPNVPVYEIAIDETRSRVIAGTHGRGAYLLDSDGIPEIDFYEEACPLVPCQNLFLLVNEVIDPADPFEVQLILEDGAVAAAGRVDAQGGLIGATPAGQLATSRAGLWSERPGIWAIFEGTGVGGVDLGKLDPQNPIASVAVVTREGRVVRSLAGSKAGPAPPSATLGLVMESAGAAGQGGGIGPRASFTLAPSIIQEDGFARCLCEVDVEVRPGDSTLEVLLRARDLINLDRRCSANGVVAEVDRILDEGDEDRPSADRSRLFLRAPGLGGVELIPSVRVHPGAAPGIAFDLGDLGVAVRNALVPVRLRLEVMEEGAGGGRLTLVERSLLGGCSVVLGIPQGSSAERIASAVWGSFQEPGRAGCPAVENPRDASLDGDSLTLVLASDLLVRVDDPGVGFSLEPENLVVAPEVGRIPGDCNADGTLDISDALCIFGVLFLGRPALFPCGSGRPGDPGNLGLLDWQPDGQVDLSDGIALLGFLFSGGPAHPLAVPGEETSACVPIAGCSDTRHCR